MADVRSFDHTGQTDGVIWPGGPSKQGPHRIESFAICPQLESYGNDLRLRLTDEKPATAIGTLVHVGLAYRYAAMLPFERWPSWLVYRDPATGYPDPLLAIASCGYETPGYAAEAARIFTWYQHFYSINVWTPVLVEHQFEVTFPNGEPYTARTDLLAIEAGEYVLIDHKTVPRLSKSIGRDYRTDRQMLTGLMLARAAGYDVKRVIINACSKEQPVPQFGRYDVPISPIAYERLALDTNYYLERLQAVRQTHPDPWNRPRNTGSCVRKYGRCDYYPLCAEGPHPEILAQYKVKPL